MNHNHSSASKGLVISFVLTCSIMVVEFIAGLLSNSLALLSDSGHMLTDALALGASLLAIKLVQQPATKKHTYGYLRAEILVALFNGATLLIISFLVFYESYRRLFAPPQVKAGFMLVVAVAGLLANLAGMYLLRKSTSSNLNIRSAFWHMMGDAVSSVGVIVGGLIIMFTGWNPVDSLISIFIGIIILSGASGIVREAANILLEAVPEGIDIEVLTSEMKKVKGVRDFHDIHLWAIGSGTYALSAHLLIEDQMISSGAEIISGAEKLLTEKFGISHTTLQLECDNCDSSLVCRLENGKHNHKSGVS